MGRRSSDNLDYVHMMKKSRKKMMQISPKHFDVYIEFFRVLRNLLDGRIDARSVRAIVQGLCRGDTDLILQLYNFPPKQYQAILPFQFQLSQITGVKGKKAKKVEENCQLPWDVLENISKTLDFDDLFHFSGVCKNWRAFHKIYLKNFLAYHEPLLLQIMYDDKKGSFSLNTISNQKVYCLKMMDCIMESYYLTFSGGYFVKVEWYKDSFLLINPFTRIKKVIKAPFKVYHAGYANHGLLAFSKCSEEFVLVVLCNISHSLRVYQSRNCGWITYSSTMENQETIAHSVVLHNIIYIVTNKANIGVLSLNSPNIKFLKLKNTPDVTDRNFNLVNCDEQLLVVDLRCKYIRNVYKIDFSTMSYVKLESLGDIALFYTYNLFYTKCYALSNPSRWGYESNSVYCTSVSSTICRVYSGDGKQLKKCFMLPTPGETDCIIYDWCFSHLQYKECGYDFLMKLVENWKFWNHIWFMMVDHLLCVQEHLEFNSNWLSIPFYIGELAEDFM
ncbi:F-box/kelch-repeat protein [Trifolium repens]|nr:F-box/kelch-repeat protein [Trifolium repens]